MSLARRSTRCALVTAGVVVAVAAATLGGGAAAASAAGAPAGPVTKVVVRGAPGAEAAVGRAVAAAGGTVTSGLPIIDGVAATVPVAGLAALGSAPGVAAVTPDASGRVLSLDPATGRDDNLTTVKDTGALNMITRIVGADLLWRAGYTGKGVDVAVIDTGVSPVKGLTSGNVVNGPDLSFDSQYPQLTRKDGYGHGTHMAGIIAGRDTAATGADYAAGRAGFTGVAPDARIVNVKVGAADGSADVSQVIAAINWVTENRNRNGLNIRVLNLSYGTDSKQDWKSDPLSYAAEVAWRKGVMVVVAAGNDGTTNEDLADPAMNPNLLAVGASDPRGTISTMDDTLPAFSNRGTPKRYVDVVAPGTHVVSLRNPHGVIDQAYPASRVGTRFTRGSGTSQATAVVSGVAALLFQLRPTATPDQMKAALRLTAVVPPSGTPLKMGAGVIDGALGASLAGSAAQLAVTVQKPVNGTGTGKLEGARGSSHVVDGAVALQGEKDIFGRAWNGKAWAPAALAGGTWNEGSWNGNAWTGSGFRGATGDWEGRTWVGSSWSGTAWAGRTWVGRTWVGSAWDGRTWVGESWSGTGWTGRSWVGSAWAGTTWS